MESDMYMDTVRFLTFVNMVMTCSENKKYNIDLNKIQLNPYKLCKNNDVYCSICISDVSNKEYIRELNCKHTFHKKCIDKWIKKCINDEIEIKCPICRENI